MGDRVAKTKALISCTADLRLCFRLFFLLKQKSGFLFDAAQIIEESNLIFHPLSHVLSKYY